MVIPAASAAGAKPASGRPVRSARPAARRRRRWRRRSRPCRATRNRSSCRPSGTGGSSACIRRRRRRRRGGSPSRRSACRRRRRTMPAATAAAEPEEEPPGVWSGSCGLRVAGRVERGELGRRGLADDGGAPGSAPARRAAASARRLVSRDRSASRVRSACRACRRCPSRRRRCRPAARSPRAASARRASGARWVEDSDARRPRPRSARGLAARPPAASDASGLDVTASRSGEAGRRAWRGFLLRVFLFRAPSGCRQATVSSRPASRSPAAGNRRVLRADPQAGRGEGR